jgi:hypothetical protein
MSVSGEKECCPNWEGKLFIKDGMPVFLHIPLPYLVGKVIGRMWKKAQDAGANTEVKDFLLLMTDPSTWRSDFFMAVTKEVPGTENVKLSGKFVSMVFDGPYNAAPSAQRNMGIIMSLLSRRFEAQG